ncbi:response regulator [Parashewanella curva]|uniref:Response regulator n=1 Tax=Parashewanella curva TaxID=2338552 RepID=A0A3L8PWJ7_9GAMM|nr:response regulator [Parashewanella curva]RLV58993.1 response regulator [Parashewanella curva]
MARLLLVDDDQGLAELLGQLLELEGFDLTLAHDGAQGLNYALADDFDLILLDVMLPKLNGFEVLRQLREQKHTPVLMLTARGDDIDRVVGLEMGADDYLSKPFNDRELVARVRAILRRIGNHTITAEQHHDDISIDVSRQEARCQQQVLPLTDCEFALLQALIEHCGEMISKETLNLQVLGKRLMPFDRSLDMHLSNLRKKLPEREDGRPRIKTVRGKGYIWLA